MTIVSPPIGAPVNLSRYPYTPIGPIDLGPGPINTPVPPPVFQPPIGPSIGPVGAGVCPPGTRCVGPSADFGGISVCLGTCSPYAGPGPNQPIDRGDLDPCPDGLELRDVGGTLVCVDPLVGPTPSTPTTPTQFGCGCNGGCPKACTTCQLPNGRTGRTNTSRYYRFGDCRRGTSAGIVEPNTVCVKPRRTNFGNIKAANRAASRIKGALRHMHKLEDTVKSTLKKGRR